MTAMRKYWSILINGIFESNPIFRLALSLCPALAVTSSVYNAFGMGMCVLFVITVNNMTVSLTRKFINAKVRVPVYITSIATIVTVVQLVLEAYFPRLYQELGIYLALIVVFAIILARAEVFAAKNPVIPSMFDGLGMGLGFAGAMVLIGSIREVFGNGSFMDIPVFGPNYAPALIMILPAGGFITIGLLIGFFNHLTEVRKKTKEETSLPESGETA